MKCPFCGKEVPSYTFTKKLTKSGNSLVISVPKEAKQVLRLKHGAVVKITITKLS